MASWTSWWRKTTVSASSPSSRDRNASPRAGTRSTAERRVTVARSPIVTASPSTATTCNRSSVSCGRSRRRRRTSSRSESGSSGPVTSATSESCWSRPSDGQRAQDLDRPQRVAARLGDDGGELRTWPSPELRVHQRVDLRLPTRDPARSLRAPTSSRSSSSCFSSPERGDGRNETARRSGTWTSSRAIDRTASSVDVSAQCTSSRTSSRGACERVGLDQVDDLVDDAVAQVRSCRRRGVARWFACKDLADRRSSWIAPRSVGGRAPRPSAPNGLVVSNG